MHSVEHYGPGEFPRGVKAGDFGLTHGDNWVQRQIQRISGSWTNHAFLIVGEDGEIAEALEWGVESENVRKYEGTEFAYVRLDKTDAVRDQVRDFALEVLKARPRYGYRTIGLIYLQLRLARVAKLLGRDKAWEFPASFRRTGTAICSSFVAECLTRAGYTFPAGPHYVTPADLARMFDAEPHKPPRQRRSMNEEQAKRGLEALKERRGEYFARMWVTRIEERLKGGETLPDLIGACLDTGAKWRIQANGSYWPTGPQGETVRCLFEATEQRFEDYGYKKPVDQGVVA